MSNLLSRWFAAFDGDRKPRQRKRPIRLRLDRLEERTVPAVLDVTSLADSGSGSLRALLGSAASGDTIDFQVAGAVNLDSVLSVTKNVTINGLGAGQDTISGQGICQVFDVSTANTALALNGLTITAGKSNSNGGGVYALASTDMVSVADCTISGNNAVTGMGGGIFAGGDVTISNSTISGNTAKTAGGGIRVTGALTVTNSTLSGNTSAGNGGGISAVGTTAITGSTLSGNIAAAGEGGGLIASAGNTITNSTIANNQARYGGGIFLNGANATTLIRETTIAANSASSTGSVGAGGIFVAGSGDMLNLQNSIVANDTDASGIAPDISNTGVAGIADYCLIGSTAGASLTGAHDLVNQAPALGTLQNNGGATQTIALQSNSPAINAGSNSLLPSGLTTDQRGSARIAGSTVDMGAFEVQPITQMMLSSSVNPAQAGQSITFKASVSATNANGAVPQGTVTFFDNGVAVDTVTLSSGHASFSTTALTGGNHTISAVYKPTDGSTASQNSLTQTVQIPTRIHLSSSVPAVRVGQTVSFTATVADVSGTPVTTGTVEFLVNRVEVGIAAVNASGQAILTTTSTWRGSPTIEVIYIPPTANPTDLIGSLTSITQTTSGFFIFARRRS